MRSGKKRRQKRLGTEGGTFFAQRSEAKKQDFLEHQLLIQYLIVFSCTFRILKHL